MGGGGWGIVVIVGVVVGVAVIVGVAIQRNSGCNGECNS